MATTSKEGSRRAITQWAKPEVVKIHNNRGPYGTSNWNEYNLNPLTRNNWRASLVPAAAVIPAPIAYIKVVAVKKLVVGCRDAGAPVCREGVYWSPRPSFRFARGFPSLGGRVRLRIVYFEKIRVFKADCLSS